MGARLEFAILGPLEVRVGGTLVPVGGPRQRALLALLLCHANHVVSRDQLIDELLADQQAGQAERMLRVQISRLRHALADGSGACRVAARPPGYLLLVEPGELDLQVFEERVAAGRCALQQGDPGQAAELLGEAEALWRGRPLADLEFEPFARFEIQRLRELRLLVAENRIEAELALGHHAPLCPQLGQLVAEHPLRERLRGQLMLALYRSGRQADALDTYRAGRSLLVEELGVEPGPELSQLHDRVLAADPGLDTPAPAATALALHSAPVIVPRELPADVSAFTGRAAELAELDLLVPRLDGEMKGGAPGAVAISALAGTAGVGKTALAVRWAHRAAGQFPDGQLYVNLRGYDSDQPLTASEALAGFLRALGVADGEIPQAEAERAARFRSVVSGRRLLVVLDNAATAQQVRPLLPGTPSVLVVVTSRDSLAGLVVRDGAHRLDLGLLPAADAVALLTTLIGERAEADPVAAGTLARLCARLPLALQVAAELAADRPGTPLAELATELAEHSPNISLSIASARAWLCAPMP
jgi:DNA-binding SARP family transcriptional activator